MNRREFLVRATIGGVSVPLLIREVGCGSSKSTNPPADSRSFTSSTNSGHSHTITIPNSDLSSTSTKNYTSSSTGHTHTVTLTAAHFDTLSSGCKVTVISSVGGGHTHTWEIVYADRGADFDVTSSSNGSPSHTHAVTIRVSDINTDPPTQKTYTTTSGGGHVHQVVLAAGDFSTLVNCAPVTVTTSVNGGHTHDFVIVRP